MSHLMNRLTNLLGADRALCQTTEQKRLSASDAAILAEFDGNNHMELAHKYHVSLQWVYRLVRQAQRETLAEALRASEESLPAEVIWVGQLLQLGSPSVLAAALRAIETATAQGRLNQLAVALVFLPPETEAAHRVASRPAPSGQAETRPDTPAPAGNAPHPQAEPQPQSN